MKQLNYKVCPSKMVGTRLKMKDSPARPIKVDDMNLSGFEQLPRPAGFACNFSRIA